MKIYLDLLTSQSEIPKKKSKSKMRKPLLQAFFIQPSTHIIKAN